jgi:transposase
MDMIGIDLHKRESQLCILAADGTVTERRIVTSRERFTAVFGSRAPARVLLEASTESEWVALCLEALGHEVIVADPNYAPMYATRSRCVKTDKRDARTLAEALTRGAYRPAHRVSPARRHARAELAVREALVRTRTRYIAIAKAFVRRDGLRVPNSESHLVAKRVATLPVPAILDAELAPLFAVLEPLNAQIVAADRRIAALERSDPIVALLATAPSVGPLTASAVVSTIDDVTRFPSAHQFEAFLGLVPGERSSGEKRRVGRITKAGNSRARYLLVEAGWRLLRAKSPETAALRAWGLKIAARRGNRIAAVALARRLAGILYAMWRDSTPYNAAKLRVPRPLMTRAG